MKYKVGDRVEIKTWKDMKEEFGEATNQMHSNWFINCQGHFLKSMEENIDQITSNRILTIERLHFNDYYYMEEEKEGKSCWTEDMIKGLEKEEIFEPIHNRWEILDL